MSRHSNYPDDIRCYDNHPNSPFYVEPPVECGHCSEEHDLDSMEESEFTDKLFCNDECREEYELEYYGCDQCIKIECECDTEGESDE